MKIFFITITMSCLLFTVSCRKSNSNAGSWTFEGVNYSTVTTALSDSALIATSGSATNQGSTLTFYFQAMPAHSGTYQVVNYTYPLDSNQLCIKFVNSSTSFYYWSTGNDHISANVSVSSAGKVSVSVPAVYLESYAAATIDSAQLTAAINQQ